MTATTCAHPDALSDVKTGACTRCGAPAVDVIMSLRERLELAERTLREIGWSTHCEYGGQHDDGSSYGIGVVDGHRCAAGVARKYFGVGT